MTLQQQDEARARDERAALWCLELAEGALSPQQQAEFDLWIGTPDNARALAEAATILGIAAATADEPEMIHMRSAALENYRGANERRWVRRRVLRWPMMGALAAACVAVMLVGIIFWSRPQVFSTGIGERQVAMLADGSKLSLDADTEVDVRLKQDRRELKLVRGRAKFDVAKDSLRPFAVTVGDKIVVATGTSFSVERLGEQVHVVLYEGHVAVLSKNDARPIAVRSPVHVNIMGGSEQLLRPGMEMVAGIDRSAPATLASIDADRSLSWERGQLVFDDEMLQSALLRMNRYSGIKLVAGDAVAARARVNGVFSVGRVDSFVEGVTAVLPLHAERTPGIITLKSN